MHSNKRRVNLGVYIYMYILKISFLSFIDMIAPNSINNYMTLAGFINHLFYYHSHNLFAQNKV
jgi:hypothetical protein